MDEVRSGGRSGPGLSRSAGRTVVDSSEYWMYLCSGNSWDLSRDGLLYFVLDCLKYLNNKWVDADSLSDTLNATRSHLISINNVLKEVESDVNVDEYKILVRACIQNTAHKKITKIGKAIHMINGEIVEDDEATLSERQPSQQLSETQDNTGKPAHQELIQHTLNFITSRRISLRDFYRMLAKKDDAIEPEKLTDLLVDKFGHDAKEGVAIFVDSIGTIKTPKTTTLVSIWHGILKYLELHIEPETVKKYNEDMKDKASRNMMNFAYQIAKVSEDVDFGDSIDINRLYDQFAAAVQHVMCL